MSSSLPGPETLEMGEPKQEKQHWMAVLFGHGLVEVQIKCIQNVNPKAHFFRAIEQGFNNCYIDARYQGTYDHFGLYKKGSPTQLMTI